MTSLEKLNHALKLLKKGPNHLPDLEAALKDLGTTERRQFAAVVKEHNIPAPRLVFFDYNTQQWLI